MNRSQHTYTSSDMAYVRENVQRLERYFAPFEGHTELGEKIRKEAGLTCSLNVLIIRLKRVLDSIDDGNPARQ